MNLRLPVAAAIAASLLLTSCAAGSSASTSSDGTPRSGGELKVAVGPWEPACLDPLVNSMAGVITSRPYSDSLFWQNEDGEFEPWLATGYEANDDGTVYTLGIREGVTFTDGAPLNAEAVKANFDYMVNPATKSQLAGAYLKPYDHSVVVDEFTLEVHLKQPYSAFINILAQSYFALLSPIQITEAPETTCEAPIGSGPFKVVKWTKGQSIEYVRNEDYNWGPPGSHEGAAYLEKLTLLLVPEDQVRYNALLSGEVDAIVPTPAENVAAVEASDEFNYQYLVRPGTAYSLHLNNSRAPFDDARVRQALAASFDREEIVSAVSFGVLDVSDFLTSSTPDFAPDLTEEIEYDTKLANDLLDDAGWDERDSEGYRTKDGERLTATAPIVGERATEKRVVELVQAEAKKVGIEIAIDLVDATTFTSRHWAGDYDIYSGLWSSNTADMLWLRWSSANISTPEVLGQNAAKFSDEKFDGLVEDARRSTDDAERNELYREAQERLVELVPSIPLYAARVDTSYPNYVKGVHYDRAYIQPLWFDVWLDR